MVKGRLDINYFEKELPAIPVSYNTRNVIALISEYEIVTSPVEKVLKAIEKAIEVAQNSTDSDAAIDVAAVPDLPADIVTAVSGLTTIIEVIQAIEDNRAQAIEDVADAPFIVEPADWEYMKFRTVQEANLELNYGINEENNIVAPEIAPIAKGNGLIDKMYSVNPQAETILLINKTKVADLADQLDIIAKSSTSMIAKDTLWTKDDLDLYSVFVKEQKSEMKGLGLIGALDLSTDDFNTMAKVKTNYMNKFSEGGITFMATSPVSVNGSNYSLDRAAFVDGVKEIDFELEETPVFWAAYIAQIPENQSLSRQIVDPINGNTISTDEFYKAKGVNGTENICLECGLIAIKQRDIITENFEVLNSNTPKYYKKLNDYLDMSITRTQDLMMNEVREGVRKLQGKKNKPVSYNALKSYVDFLITVYVPDYVDSLNVSVKKDGSAKVIATVESDYTNIIGPIDVYGYNNVN